MKIFPIFIPHLGCPFQCIYCNQHAITNSDLPDISSLQKKIEEFCNNNKNQEKQIAFFGGTFTSLSKEFQTKLLDCVKPFLSDINGIRISTRPDTIDDDILVFLKSKGVQTIELGIQSFSNNVLQESRRGYNRKIALQNSKLIKAGNFELGIQLMPGLTGFSEESLAKTIFYTKQIKPDFVRIYPTIILKDTKLAKLYNSKKYQPLSLDNAITITSHMISEFEGINIAKIGLHSDISKDNIIAGPFHRTFGELVRAEMLFNKISNSYEARTLMISSYDISLFKGFKGRIIQKLKQEKDISTLPIIVDKILRKNSFLFTDKKPEQLW